MTKNFAAEIILATNPLDASVVGTANGDVDLGGVTLPLLLMLKFLRGYRLSKSYSRAHPQTATARRIGLAPNRSTP